MDEIKLNDNLDEVLDQANGSLTVTIEGLTSHIHGNANKVGMLLATHSFVVGMVQQYEMDFEEVIELVRNVNEILESNVGA